MGISIPDPELLGGLAGKARPLPGVLCLPCKLQPNGMSGCGSDVGGSELVSQRLASNPRAQGLGVPQALTRAGKVGLGVGLDLPDGHKSPHTSL